MSEQWQEIKPELNKTWNNKVDGVFSLEEGDELIGTLVEKKEDVGPNHSKVYSVKTDKEVIDVWGSTVLDTRLKNVEEGDDIKIVYLGIKKSEKTKREYHDYSLFKKPKEDIPVVEDDEIDVKEIPL